MNSILALKIYAILGVVKRIKSRTTILAGTNGIGTARF